MVGGKDLKIRLLRLLINHQHHPQRRIRKRILTDGGRVWNNANNHLLSETHSLMPYALLLLVFSYLISNLLNISLRLYISSCMFASSHALKELPSTSPYELSLSVLCRSKQANYTKQALLPLSHHGRPPWSTDFTTRMISSYSIILTFKSA